MLDDADPQAATERRAAARQLLATPLLAAEREPDVFRLVRRHEAALDRWFTQRLGYRLHLDADTARLFKTGTVPDRRPLRHPNGRALTQREHTLVALALAATAAGPSVISLRDLLLEIRSAAAEVEIELHDSGVERRSLVNAIKWMIELDLVEELHEHIDRYADDAEADAVLRVRPDRIALVLIPTVAGSDGVGPAVAAAERRSATRQWLRARLVEEPVVYRSDLTDAEWAELRRRAGEEERLLDEMFGFVLESRAEGVAAIDPDGPFGDRVFPAGGTLGHATLLLLDRLAATDGAVDRADIAALLADLVATTGRRWSKRYVEHPEALLREVVELLVDLRLLAPADAPDAYRVLPAAVRFAPEPVGPTSPEAHVAEAERSRVGPDEQGTLW